MLIDWFTVGAQALNFLILVWLMKRFLYKPILDAIDTRQKMIAKEEADTSALKKKAQQEHDDFQHKNEDFDKKRSALLAKATADADAERQRLLEEARKAADALKTKRQEALQHEAHDLSQGLSHLARDEVFAIARKALTDLASTSLEARMGEMFTRRLRALGAPTKKALAAALKTGTDPARVRSAFDLPPAQRAAIQQALNDAFGADIRVRFETAPDLISGIELTMNGQRLAWTISEYLTSLEKGVDELLDVKEKPHPKAKPKAKAKAALAVRRRKRTAKAP